MRLPLAIAFFTVAILSLVNVQAYRRSTVTNPTTFAVVATDSAALALAARGTGNSVNQVSYTANGVMRINFGKGAGGTARALQQGRQETTATNAPVNLAADAFKMLGVFTVTNNSATCQDVSVNVAGGTAVNLTDIYGRLTGGATPGVRLAAGSGAPVGSLKLGTTAGTNQMEVDFWWNATTPAASAGTFTLQVSATKSATCP